MEHKVLQDLLPKANMSVYTLVRMASKRALELADGKKCLVDLPLNEKATTKALEEIYAGRVVAKDCEHLLYVKKENDEDSEE
ncbi:MAG: DNA-directed RNA polymerase omega subunit [Lysobacterales bacterium]|jgi:DNA-directed RNA polymerase omega subunit